MEINCNPYDYFLAAFKNEIECNWTGKRKYFADKIGISVPYLSEIEGSKKKAGDKVQKRVCNFIGIKIEEFISIGRSLVESPSDGSETPQPKKQAQLNIIQFHEHSVKDPKTEKMHKDLDTILQSGDEELIDAIRLNLMSFRKKVEMQKEIEEQGKRIAALETAARK